MYIDDNSIVGLPRWLVNNNSSHDSGNELSWQQTREVLKPTFLIFRFMDPPPRMKFILDLKVLISLKTVLEYYQTSNIKGSYGNNCKHGQTRVFGSNNLDFLSPKSTQYIRGIQDKYFELFWSEETNWGRTVVIVW